MYFKNSWTNQITRLVMNILTSTASWNVMIKVTLPKISLIGVISKWSFNLTTNVFLYIQLRYSYLLTETSKATFILFFIYFYYCWISFICFGSLFLSYYSEFMSMFAIVTDLSALSEAKFITANEVWRSITSTVHKAGSHSCFVNTDSL